MNCESDTPESSSTASAAAQSRGETLTQGVAILLAMMVVQRLVGFGRGVVFCRLLEPEAYGEWGLIFNFLLLAAPLAVLGLPGSFGRYLEHYRQRGSLRVFLVRTGLASLLFALATVVVVATHTQQFAELIFGRGDLTSLVVLVAVCLAAVILHHFLESLYMALRMTRVVSCMRFAQSLGFALLGVFLLVASEATSASIVIAYTASSLISAAGSLFALRGILDDQPEQSQPIGQRVFWGRLLPFTLWIWIINILTNLFAVADRWMIVHLGNLRGRSAGGGRLLSERADPAAAAGVGRRSARFDDHPASRPRLGGGPAASRFGPGQPDLQAHLAGVPLRSGAGAAARAVDLRHAARRQIRRGPRGAPVGTELLHVLRPVQHCRELPLLCRKGAARFSRAVARPGRQSGTQRTARTAIGNYRGGDRHHVCERRRGRGDAHFLRACRHAGRFRHPHAAGRHARGRAGAGQFNHCALLRTAGGAFYGPDIYPLGKAPTAHSGSGPTRQSAQLGAKQRADRRRIEPLCERRETHQAIRLPERRYAMQVTLADGSRADLDKLSVAQLERLQFDQEQAFASQIKQAPKGSQARREKIAQGYDTVCAILRQMQSGGGLLQMGLDHRYVRLVLRVLRSYGRSPGQTPTLFEIGYGSGGMLVAAVEAGYRVAGIEVSPAVREEALAALPSAHRERLFCGDLLTHALPECRGRFDVVYWNDVFEHIPPDEIGEYLTRIRELLRPGGCLITITPNWHERPSDVTYDFCGPRSEARGLHLKEYTLSDVISLLASAGLERVSTPLLISPLAMHLGLGGLAGCKRWCEPLLERLPFVAAQKLCHLLGLSCTLAYKPLDPQPTDQPTPATGPKRGRSWWNRAGKRQTAAASVPARADATSLPGRDGGMLSSVQNRPLRILFLLTSMPVGGAEVLLVNLVRKLDRSRFAPEICCLKEPGELGEAMAAELPVHCGLLRNKYDLRVLPRLVRLLKQRGADAVVTVGAGDKMFWGRLAARLAGVKAVVSALHSTGWPDGVGRLNRLLTPLTDAFIAVAENHRQHLIRAEKFPAEKVVMIPNGVDLERFAPLPKSDALGAELGLVPSAPLVGIVAALRPEKNHRLFLSVAVEVLQDVPDANFLIVGDGPLRGSLEQYAQQLGIGEQVHFLGTRSDIAPLLALLDVFLLTSDNEANPVSILEAMSMAKPVVATRVGSVPEVVEPERTGYLAEVGDSVRLAGHVTRLLLDPLLAQQMGRAGREKVVSQWSLDRMVKGYEVLLDRIVAAKQGRLDYDSRTAATVAPAATEQAVPAESNAE